MSSKTKAAGAKPPVETRVAEPDQGPTKVQAAEENPWPTFLGLFHYPGFLVDLPLLVVKIYALYWICLQAYSLRLFAIQEYGPVIHEFDPWFNFRATEYLEREGWTKFFTWFDYMSWYPLGRPVGTTIYPGMQITAVAIYRALNMFGPFPMSLNDVCAYIPAWFGVVATLFLALITYECSKSTNAAVAAAFVMAIIPAHMMRSVGGGFDNESIAMSALCATFYFWVLSIRNKSFWPVGILTGFAYAYMVAAWGGFIFVLNLIGVHAAFLIVLNTAKGVHSSSLYRAYSLFYVIGTAGAVHVPVVGWGPFKSLEQLGPFVVFIIFQLLEFCAYRRRVEGYQLGSWTDKKTKIIVFFLGICAVGAVAAYLYPTGYFGPLTARVRGLFLKHTRTGNPLVDSVAEHQPASADAYWHYLNYALYPSFVGLAFTLLNLENWTQGSFLIIYGYAAYFFSGKMVRLLLIAAPVCSALAGIGIGFAIDWCQNQIFVPKPSKNYKISPFQKLNDMWKSICEYYHTPAAHALRVMIMVALIAIAVQRVPGPLKEFREHSEKMAHQFSHPQIMYKAKLQDGTQVLVDDYREAYFWLRAKTPRSSRVMAWWDYGYQITGIGNRTTIADGNTWNHEHIATLGYCLSGPVKRSHSIIRHLADYVLVWAGGGGDDLAKSPHMARIANSVYGDVCPGDPTCNMFGFYNDGRPTPMMAASLLYNLIGHKQRPGVVVDSSLFQEAYSSKYGLVRIFKVMNVSKESKAWAADPANRKCDAPGSWYCVGQYPPVKPIQDLLARKRDFKQLEDFNTKERNEYSEEYLKKMEDPNYKTKQQRQQKEREKFEDWIDDEYTTQMWQLIEAGDIKNIQSWLEAEPEAIKMRAKDGRGPLWWAYEKGDKKIIDFFIKKGAKENEKDKKGLKPKDLAKN